MNIVQTIVLFDLCKTLEGDPQLRALATYGDDAGRRKNSACIIITTEIEASSPANTMEQKWWNRKQSHVVMPREKGVA
jgi:hypothetical protein